jgi:hypothetical protein
MIRSVVLSMLASLCGRTVARREPHRLMRLEILRDRDIQACVAEPFRRGRRAVARKVR